MRLALLDLGTTALRFEVFELSAKDYLEASGPQHLERIYRERLMPRLGTDLYANGQLNPAGMLETREFFARIPQLKLTHEVEHCVIAATSALREASDGPSFLSELEALAKQRIRLLSGEEEAELTARGILCNEAISEPDYLLVDIGGGSTEFSQFSGGELVFSKSVLLGAIRGNHTYTRCHEDDVDPPSPQGVEALRAHVRKELTTALGSTTAPLIIGSSGTIRSLSKLDSDARRDSSYLYKDELHDLVSRLHCSNFNERLKIQGLERNRADIIVPGAIIFEEIFEHVQAERMRVSLYSLRHGLLDETLHSLLQKD